MIRLSLAALLAVAITASAAPCQQRIEVAPGTRVRLTVPTFVDGVAVNRSATTSIGTVLGIDSTSITARMENGGAVQTLPFNVLTHLEISRGRVPVDESSSRGVVRGALVGGGLTMATYALYYLVQVHSNKTLEKICEDFEDESDCSKRGAPYALEIIGGATLGGALVGFTVGSLKRERWERVRPRSLAPIDMPREVSLSVSLQM